MKTFICVLVLATVANALFLGGGSNGGGGGSGSGSGGKLDFLGPPPVYHRPPTKHIVDIFHHSAPAHGGGDMGTHHTHLVKVIHESGGGFGHGGGIDVHHEEPLNVIKVIKEVHAPLVHHAPAAHLQLVKVLHEHEHAPVEEPIWW